MTKHISPQILADSLELAFEGASSNTPVNLGTEYELLAETASTASPVPYVKGKYKAYLLITCHVYQNKPRAMASTLIPDDMVLRGMVYDGHQAGFHDESGGYIAATLTVTESDLTLGVKSTSSYSTAKYAILYGLKSKVSSGSAESEPEYNVRDLSTGVRLIEYGKLCLLTINKFGHATAANGNKTVNILTLPEDVKPRMPIYTSGTSWNTGSGVPTATRISLGQDGVVQVNNLVSGISIDNTYAEITFIKE